MTNTWERQYWEEKAKARRSFNESCKTCIPEVVFTIIANNPRMFLPHGFKGFISALRRLYGKAVYIKYFFKAVYPSYTETTISIVIDSDHTTVLHHE